MAAIVEQEFQEIDATNDWQARYLVREEAGRRGVGGCRRRRPPPQQQQQRAEDGERAATRQRPLPVCAASAGSGSRWATDSFSGARSETAGRRRACSREAAAASPREGRARGWLVRRRRGGAPARWPAAGGAGGAVRLRGLGGGRDPCAGCGRRGAEGLTEWVDANRGRVFSAAVSSQSGKLSPIRIDPAKACRRPGSAALRSGSSGSGSASSPARYRCPRPLGAGSRPARSPLRKYAACPFPLETTGFGACNYSLWVSPIKQTSCVSLQYESSYLSQCVFCSAL